MAKRGRPKWQPPDNKRVEALAARGLTDAQIAAALEISQDTLIRRKREFCEFCDAIKKGRAKGVGEIANALFESAKTGNTAAQIFFLKSQGNWKETMINEMTGANGKLIEHEVKHQVTIYLPNNDRD